MCRSIRVCALCLFCCTSWVLSADSDPLPSWNDGASKASIIEFVERISVEGPDFVPVDERIATFDNDGTLWSEQPYYFQIAFAIDQVKVMAPDHPEWAEQNPVLKAAIDGDIDSLAASGKKGLVELLTASHSGMTEAEFSKSVTNWITTAKHPRFDRLYSELVYQPMLELLVYLRANGFKTYIVSGGGIAFMRPWTEAVYEIPPEQVVGSSIKTEFEIREGEPVLVRLPEIDFIDDKAGKPVGINKFIGRRPIAAFGNSDGDLEMLQWTTGTQGLRLGLIVHHTDDVREWAYDKDSHIGNLDKALTIGRENGWTIVDMKQDWKVIYPFQMNK